MIRKILFIVSLCFLFFLNQKSKTIEESHIFSQQEMMVTNHLQQEPKQDTLTNEEFSSSQSAAIFTNCRQLQTQGRGSERLIKETVKQLTLFYQKGQEILNKTSEILSINRSYECSSLRIRSGHWIYAIRKIVI